MGAVREQETPHRLAVDAPTRLRDLVQRRLPAIIEGIYIAAVLDQAPRMLMRGKPRAPSNCWIVSETTGRPTGYADADLHPELMSNEAVLKTREELAAWLASQPSD